ncbi:hypothetical protein [Trichocoleus sp. FACHB-832]|uniref:hypothetical protein n=1 Tax=Trichocoleus sp. FACHB-832 TaxID=2692875 RepID=UPI001F556094|nr:hypothetical protein [Trichocoleus sp. FACHB-832]
MTRKILHSLRHGSQMRWLIDPDERVVLVYLPSSLSDELLGDTLLPCSSEFVLELTVVEMFSLLKVAK